VRPWPSAAARRAHPPGRRRCAAAAEPGADRGSLVAPVVAGTASLLAAGLATVYQDDILDFWYDQVAGNGLTTGLAAGGAGGAVAATLWAVALRLVSPWQLLLTFLLIGSVDEAAPCERARAQIESVGAPPPLAAALELAGAAAAGAGVATLLAASLGDSFGVATGLGARAAGGLAQAARPRARAPDEAAADAALAAAFQTFADARLTLSGRCHESEVMRAFRAAHGPARLAPDVELRSLVRAWGGRGVDRTPNGYLKGVSLARPDA